MLLQFAVENFLSIQEQVVLSMLAPAGTTLAPRYVRQVGPWSVLRCAAIYGANAAGKSNVIKALEVFRALVTKGSAPDQPTGVTGFRLDAAWRGRPTRFEVEVALDGVRYSYGIEVTSEAIVSEWLYRGEGDDEQMLFERERGEDGAKEHRFKFGEIAGDEEQKQFVRFVAKGTPANQPLLVECRQRNVTEYLKITDWIAALTIAAEQSFPYRQLIPRLMEGDTHEFVEQRLASWGTGVTSIVLRIAPTLPQARGDEKHITLDEWTARTRHPSDASADNPTITDKVDDRFVTMRLHFHHAGSSGESVLDWQDESEGTRRLMHLLPVLRQIHQHPNGGQLVAVDELERSLHPALTRRFVEEFLDLCAASPDTTAQMIFTTHDTNLLNGRLLPPASIWFVEKDRAGATHLYSLAEYPTAQVEALTEHLEDGYLQGRFGAIPFVASRDQLSWSPLKTGT
jgi:AAA15 family ATPase/GTPase